MTDIRRETFHVRMAAVCVAVALAGFSMSYWTPLVRGTLTANPVVHLHGAVFLLWLLLLLGQGWLASRGSLRGHRHLGLLGASLATLVVVLGLLACLNATARMATQGAPLPVVHAVLGALVGDLVPFAAFVILALVHRHRPQAHRGLMLLSAIAILGAAPSRWYTALGSSVGAFHGALTADLLVIPLLVHEWRRPGGGRGIVATCAAAMIVFHATFPLRVEAAFTRQVGGLLWALAGR